MRTYAIALLMAFVLNGCDQKDSSQTGSKAQDPKPITMPDDSTKPKPTPKTPVDKAQETADTKPTPQPPVADPNATPTPITPKPTPNPTPTVAQKENLYFFTQLDPTKKDEQEQKDNLVSFLKSSYSAGDIIPTDLNQVSAGICVIHIPVISDKMDGNIPADILALDKKCPKGLIWLFTKLTNDELNPQKSVFPSSFDVNNPLEIYFLFAGSKFDIPANINFPDKLTLTLATLI